MPDDEPAWTDEELDEWARQQFGDDLWVLDDVTDDYTYWSHASTPEERRLADRASQLLPRSFAGLWSSRRDSQTRSIEHKSMGTQTAQTRWDGLAPDTKATLRRDWEKNEWARRDAERASELEDDSIVPELAPDLVGTGEVPGDLENEEEGRSSWRTVAAWAAGAFAVLAFAGFFVLNQQDEDDEESNESAGEVATDDATTDERENAESESAGEGSEADTNEPALPIEFLTESGDVVTVEVPPTTTSGQPTVVRMRVLDDAGSPRVGLEVRATIGNNPAGDDARHGMGTTDADGWAEIEVEGPPEGGAAEVRVSVDDQVELVGETDVVAPS